MSNKTKTWKTRRLNARRLRRRLRRVDIFTGRKNQAAPRYARQDVVYFPEIITLLTPQGHAGLATALEDLRLIFSTSSSVCLDFSYTKQLMPEGMLLLYAELTRLNEAFPGRSLSCRPSRALKVSHVLQHLGVYGLLNYQAPDPPEGEDVVPWQKIWAKGVDVQGAGELIEGQPSLSPEETGILFKSVSEAVVNVTHHSSLAAREDDLKLPPTKQWWMFSHESKSRLYIAVCDLGIGIPRSLPRVHTLEKVQEAISRMFGDKRPTDGRMIHAALRLGRTRTHEENRGLGFTDIIQIVNAVPGSFLQIYSNRGGLVYKADDLRPSIKNRTFKNSILGTILVWSFPLKGDQNEQ